MQKSQDEAELKIDAIFVDSRGELPCNATLTPE
jgi:hypothetical protein